MHETYMYEYILRHSLLCINWNNIINISILQSQYSYKTFISVSTMFKIIYNIIHSSIIKQIVLIEMFNFFLSHS